MTVLELNNKSNVTLLHMISCDLSGTGFNPVNEKKIMDPLRTTTKLRRLEPDTQYTIFVWALTSKGRGDVFFIESTTREATGR